MTVAIDINRAERRSQAKQRRREVAFEANLTDLQAKRAKAQHALESVRAKILRRIEEQTITRALPFPAEVSDSFEVERASKWRTAFTVQQCSEIQTQACCAQPVDLGSEDAIETKECYRLLDGLRPFSRKRTAQCRLLRIAKTVQLYADGKTVKVGGVACCGNVHGCPVCAARIYARRSFEIDSMLSQWIGYGPERKGPENATAHMLTLTVSHAVSTSLETTLRGVAEAWRDLFTGRAGQALRAMLTMKHFARSLELTHGKNGWHPHLHVIALTEGALTEEAELYLTERWQEAVAKHCGAQCMPDDLHGVDVKRLSTSNDGRYVEKMGLEIAGIITKGGRNGNRTFWQLAHDAAKGDRVAVALWKEAQACLFASRQLTWSRGTRERFELPDVTDLEASGDSAEDGSETLPATESIVPFRLDVAPERWDAAKRRDRFFLSRLVGACVSAWTTGSASSVLALLEPSWLDDRSPEVSRAENNGGLLSGCSSATCRSDG